MKKLKTLSLISILMMLFFYHQAAEAQTYKYQTYAFAYQTYNYQWQRWSGWSDWENSNMLVVISLDRDIITIYSQSTQEYDIVEYQGQERDRDGGESLKFLCVNEDGLRCNIRVRNLRDGQRQLYVDFADAMWVYNIANK